jgi:hypothetical protein
MSSNLRQRHRKRKYLQKLARVVSLRTGLSRTAARQTLLALEAADEIEIDAEHKRVLLLTEEVGRREDLKALRAADPAHSTEEEEGE